jgi:diacylglycerol kinase
MDKEAREAKEAGSAALFIVALFLFTQLLNNFVFN